MYIKNNKNKTLVYYKMYNSSTEQFITTMVYVDVT